MDDAGQQRLAIAAAIDKLTAMVEDVVRKLDSTNVILEEIVDALQEKNDAE